MNIHPLGFKTNLKVTINQFLFAKDAVFAAQFETPKLFLDPTD